MKLLTIKSAIAILTFIVSIMAVTFWLNKSSNDSTVYSVRLCDLINNSNQYDGKFVRTQGVYRQGVERLHLTDNDCSEMLRTIYSWDDNSERIRKQIGTITFTDRARVDVIGLFKANVTDPDPPVSGIFSSKNTSF
jgi:hypothetical protein